MAIVLPTAYLPPIHYFSLLTRSESIIMERFEHYPKQTYRNRCNIYGANGSLALTVPVTKGNELKVYTKDIRIDNSTNWRKIHLKALESAYQNSPYYQYYIDELTPIITKNLCYLYDLNLQLIECICQLVGICPVIKETDEYARKYPDGLQDYREAMHPKERMWNTELISNLPVYHQVFDSKHGFLPNLSIVDLLFNTGPESKKLLSSC
jgi:hypothetical protein